MDYNKRYINMYKTTGYPEKYYGASCDIEIGKRNKEILDEVKKRLGLK